MTPGLRLRYGNPRLMRTMFLHLQQQQTAGLFCDVILQGNGDGISVHACLLAACSPYMAHFLSSLDKTDDDPGHTKQVECSRHVIKMPGFSSHCLLSLVRYLYTSELEVSPADAHDVLEAAKILQIQELELLKLEGGRLVMSDSGKRLNRKCLQQKITKTNLEADSSCGKQGVYIGRVVSELGKDLQIRKAVAYPIQDNQDGVAAPELQKDKGPSAVLFEGTKARKVSEQSQGKQVTTPAAKQPQQKKDGEVLDLQSQDTQDRKDLIELSQNQQIKALLSEDISVEAVALMDKNLKNEVVVAENRQDKQNKAAAVFSQEKQEAEPVAELSQEKKDELVVAELNQTEGKANKLSQAKHGKAAVVRLKRKSVVMAEQTQEQQSRVAVEKLRCADDSRQVQEENVGMSAAVTATGDWQERGDECDHANQFPASCDNHKIPPDHFKELGSTKNAVLLQQRGQCIDSGKDSSDMFPQATQRLNDKQLQITYDTNIASSTRLVTWHKLSPLETPKETSPSTVDLGMPLQMSPNQKTNPSNRMRDQKQYYANNNSAFLKLGPYHHEPAKPQHMNTVGHDDDVTSQTEQELLSVKHNIVHSEEIKDCPASLTEDNAAKMSLCEDSTQLTTSAVQVEDGLVVVSEESSTRARSWLEPMRKPLDETTDGNGLNLIAFEGINKAIVEPYSNVEKIHTGSKRQHDSVEKTWMKEIKLRKLQCASEWEAGSSNMQQTPNSEAGSSKVQWAPSSESGDMVGAPGLEAESVDIGEPDWEAEINDVVGARGWEAESGDVAGAPDWEAETTKVAGAPGWEADSDDMAGAPGCEAESGDVAGAPGWEAETTKVAGAPGWEADSDDMAGEPGCKAESGDIAGAPGWEAEIIKLVGAPVWEAESGDMVDAPVWEAESGDVSGEPVWEEDYSLYSREEVEEELSDIEELFNFILNVPGLDSPELDVGAYSPIGAFPLDILPDMSTESDTEVDVFT